MGNSDKSKFNPAEMTVVVVDDQDQIRKAIKRVLERMSFKVIVEASNGSGAIACIKDHNPSLVICDLNLGEVSGFDVLEMLRTKNLGADIPILMVTGEASRDDIVKAVDLGANDYLLKPFQPEDLEKKVVKLLDAFANPDPLLQKIRATEKLLMENKFKEALDPLGEANAIESKNVRVRYLHAFALMKTGQANVAEKVLEKILTEQPAYFRANAMLADYRIVQGRPGEAAKLMQTELEYNGKQPDRHVQLANLFLEQGNPEGAIEHCRKALLIDQRMRSALLTMGHAQVKNGNIDKGIYYFKRLRRYYPDAREALEAIVNTCERIKDLRRAEFALRDERATNPQQTDATVLLARVYFMQEKLDDAVAVAGELTNSGAADEANMILAMAEMKNGRRKEALAALEKIQNTKDQAYVYRLRAELHLQLANPARAEAEAVRSFAAEPWSEQALLVQATALTQTNSPAKAILTLMKASTLGAPADVVMANLEDAKAQLRKRRKSVTPQAQIKAAS